MKKLQLHMPSRKTLRIVLPIAFVLVLTGSVLLNQVVDLPKGTATAEPVSVEEYQESLKAQVSNADGSPGSGRNPASQSQTSLASAASTPSGTGMRTNTPAAGTSGSTQYQVTSDDVYGSTDEQRAKGINAAGCFYDYGIPGEQCMPASMANAQGALECPMVRAHYPQGLKVSGTDRFKLDTNADGTACGVNDK